MNIFAKEGTKVIVTENSIKNGYNIVKEHARKFLEVGTVYTIDHTEVDSWDTKVYLKEFPGKIFNSVSFEDMVQVNNAPELGETYFVKVDYKIEILKLTSPVPVEFHKDFIEWLKNEATALGRGKHCEHYYDHDETGNSWIEVSFYVSCV